MLGYTDMSTKPQRKPLCGIWMLVLALLLFALTLVTVAMLEAGRAQTQEEQASAGNVFLVSRLWTTYFNAPTNETGDEITATVERIARDAKNDSHSNNYYEEQRAVVVNAESAPPIMAERQDEFGPPQSRMDSYEADPIYDAVDDYEIQQSSEERESVGQTPGEGRAATQGRPFDSYYGQWHHDSKTAASASAPAPATPPAAAPGYNYRKLPPSSNR